MTSPEPIDRWLTDYFHRKLPTPFPPLAAPTVAPVRARDVASASRWVLAGSLLALLVAGSWLAGRMPRADFDPSTPILDGSAKLPANAPPK